MENKQLNWCIRLSFEIILVFVCLAPTQNTSDSSAAQTTPPVQDSPGKPPGVGRSLASVTLTVQPEDVSFQNRNCTLEDLTRLTGEAGPDQIVIKLNGPSWKSFFDWALQHDKPVCIIGHE